MNLKHTIAAWAVVAALLHPFGADAPPPVEHVEPGALEVANGDAGRNDIEVTPPPASARGSASVTVTVTPAS